MNNINIQCSRQSRSRDGGDSGGNDFPIPKDTNQPTTNPTPKFTFYWEEEPTPPSVQWGDNPIPPDEGEEDDDDDDGGGRRTFSVSSNHYVYFVQCI